MTAVRDKTSMKMQNTNKDTQKTPEWQQQPQGDKEMTRVWWQRNTKWFQGDVR